MHAVGSAWENTVETTVLYPGTGEISEVRPYQVRTQEHNAQKDVSGVAPRHGHTVVHHLSSGLNQVTGPTSARWQERGVQLLTEECSNSWWRYVKQGLRQPALSFGNWVDSLDGQ
jgi:hypothetical protein